MNRLRWFMLALLAGAFGFAHAEHALIARSMSLAPPPAPDALQKLLTAPPVPQPRPVPPPPPDGGMP